MPAVLHLLATDRRRGAESFGVQLHDELARRGWQSSLAAVRSDGGQVPAPALGSGWWDPRGLADYVRRARRADVVVAHGSTTLWTAALASSVVRTPFVYVNIGDPRFWTASAHRRVRVRYLLRRAAAVAAISEGAAEALRDHLDVSPDRIVVLSNARSTERFAPATPVRRRAARAALDLPDAAPVVAFLGALSPEKRPGLAVRAVAPIAGAHLLVAGDGPLLDEVRSLTDVVMPGRGHVLGAVADPLDVLLAADCLVLTSASEGVPGALIEAGLMALPAVTTGVGYAAEVVLDGRTGRVVPDADEDKLVPDLSASLREALAARDAWGAAARTHCVATFGLDEVVLRWEALLRRTVPEALAS